MQIESKDWEFKTYTNMEVYNSTVGAEIRQALGPIALKTCEGPQNFPILRERARWSLNVSRFDA